MLASLLKKLNIELFFWTIGLAVLAFSDPGKQHYSLCPLKNLGFRYCPGCGLGHSISWLLHGDISASFHAHPLGIFALIVIVHRIFILLKHQYLLSFH